MGARKMSNISRRKILSGMAVAAGGLAAANLARGAEGEKKDEIPTFRYAMEQQRGKVSEGGSAKEATIKQLPISKGLAGVSMRLKPGGMRELHWHANAAEWAFMLKGRVRTTVLGPDRTSETNDFEPGDVWYFPRGHGHAVQNLGTEEAHFILIFDNGAFSEHGTFSITDWFAQTSPSVLSRSLGMPETTFARFPKDELYIVQGRVPPEKIEAPLQRQQRLSPQTHRYPLMAQLAEKYPGGEERRVSVKEFPISKTMTGVVLDLKPGAVREPHWHPNANEWQYFISGKARITLFGSGGRSRSEEFGQGDAGYVPQGFGHHIENIGDTDCRILIAFDSGDYQEISLSTWLASNPPRLLADTFKIPDALAEKFPDHRVFLASKNGPGAREEK
jgi:oxalate decarboxylase